MTLVLFTVLIVVSLSLLLYKQIRRFRYYIYAVFALVAIVLGGEDANIISLGYMRFSFFLVGMYTGVLDRSLVKKRLLAVRAELSVLGAILIAPHAISFLEYLLEDVGVFSANLSYYIGILAFVVMIPLALTSFTYVRKMVGGKRWKALHQYTYLFYGLVGLHLILIGNDRMVIYIALFGVYFILKVQMLLTKSIKRKQNEKERAHS
jgi:DMSO/TMAO reductase YedYZ heme-binding membrane subunit